MNSYRKPVGIHTTIPYEIWMKAQTGGISWTKALEIGIIILTGNKDDENHLKSKIHEAESTVEYYKKKLAEIQDKKTQGKKALKVIKDHLKKLAEASEIIKKDIKFLNVRTKLWNSETGLSMTPEDFYKLCQRYDKGEFRK